MRNYIKELKERGYKLYQIAQESGLSEKFISGVYHGKRRVKSYTRQYEIIRNVSRRYSYREARRAGLSSARASEQRRTAFNIQWEMAIKESVREVKHRQENTYFQLRMLAEYEHSQTHDITLMESTSYAHKDKDEKRDIDEAINNARGKLQDSHFRLKRIIEKEYITYVLKSDETDTS